MTEQEAALTKQEKQVIQDSRKIGTMGEEEWARVQGMTYSELRRGSSVGSFFGDAENKL